MLMKCSECGKTVSDTASTCPHCGAPVKKSSNTKEIKLIIEFKGGLPAIRKTDRFHVLLDGRPIGLASYNEPFKFEIAQSISLAIKLKGFMQYRSEPVFIEYGKVSSVKFSVTYVDPLFRSYKATYKLEEIK